MRNIGFCCQGCDGYFDWNTEERLVADEHCEVKTIASRYCVGCIDLEVRAHNIPRDRVIEMRRELGRKIP